MPKLTPQELMKKSKSIQVPDDVGLPPDGIGTEPPQMSKEDQLVKDLGEKAQAEVDQKVAAMLNSSPKTEPKEQPKVAPEPEFGNFNVAFSSASSKAKAKPEPLKEVKKDSKKDDSANNANQPFSAEDERVKKALEELDRIKDLRDEEEINAALEQWADKYGDLYTEKSISKKAEANNLTSRLEGILKGKAESAIPNSPIRMGIPVPKLNGNTSQEKKDNNSTWERQTDQPRGSGYGRGTMGDIASQASQATSNAAEALVGGVTDLIAATAGAGFGALKGAGRVAKSKFDEYRNNRAAKNNLTSSETDFGLGTSGKAQAEKSFAENQGAERMLFGDAMESLGNVELQGKKLNEILTNNNVDKGSYKQNFLQAIAVLPDEVQESILSQQAEFTKAVMDANNKSELASGKAMDSLESISENSLKDNLSRYSFLRDATSKFDPEIKDLPISEQLVKIGEKGLADGADNPYLDSIMELASEDPEAVEDMIKKTEKAESKLNDISEMIKKLVEAIMAMFKRGKDKGVEATAEHNNDSDQAVYSARTM
jgi:hypothetical protein